MKNRISIYGHGCLVAFFMLLSSTPLQAQDAGPWQKIFGAWNISYEDQKRGVVKGYAVLTQPGRMIGKIYYPNGEKGFVVDSLKLEGTTLKGTYWPYFEAVKFELQLSGDGNTLSGQWTERASNEKGGWRDGQRQYDHPDKPEWYTAKGRETWTRAMPQIESITVVPVGNGALDYPKMQEVWKYAAVRANLPIIALDVKGQNLPLHLETYQEYLDLKLDDPKLLYHTFEPKPKASTVRLLLWLAKDTRPGRKSLTLNGVQANWELRFANYNGEASEPLREPPRVRFVRPTTGGFAAIKELAFNTPFLVEVQFNERPDEDQRTVTLTWPGAQPRKVPVARSKDDPKLYRSKLLKLANPGG